MNDLNFRTLDLNLLRVFDEVMAERNLTRAAHNLSMTQPAVSNALRRLRELVGDDLVRRAGYGVEPTPRAVMLWPTVRESLAQLQKALAPGHFNPASTAHHFVLAMADATAAKIMPGLVQRMAQEAPMVSLRVLPLTTRDPRTLLENSDVDLAIGHFPGVMAELAAPHLQEHVPPFQARRLYETDYVVVMRHNHPLASRDLSLDEFCAAQHLLVSFSGRPWGFVDEALATLSRRRRVVLTVNQFFTAGLVVASSDLLTVLPSHFVSMTGQGHTLVQRPIPLEMPNVRVDMLWHRQTHALSPQQWLRDLIARTARQEDKA
jgi:DNA-binding transcriptional LysR family regulator